MNHTTVRRALQYAAANPERGTDSFLEMPTHYLVCRRLISIAMTDDASTLTAQANVNKAQRMLFDRLSGTRRSGSLPATKNTEQLEFQDLTQSVIGGGDDEPTVI